jgi:uncharacterized protein
MDLAKILSRIDFEVFCEKRGIRSLAIFGSYSRGEQTPQSDLDVLVEFSKPVSLLRQVQIQQELEEILGLKVDLVTPAGVSPYLRPQILSSRKIIYEKAA